MTFPERFRALSQSEQDAVLNEISQAIKWRGWDRGSGIPGSLLSGRGVHAMEAIRKIMAVFEAAQGVEFEEFT